MADDSIQKIRVTIRGMEYTLRGQASETHLRTVARSVDSLMQQIASANPHLDERRIAVLAAANVVDELLRIREAHSEWQAEYHILKADHRDLQAEYRDLQVEHRELHTEHGDLVTEHRSLQAEYHTLHAWHQTLQSGQRDLAAKYRDLEVEHQKLQAQYSDFQAKHGD